MVYWQSRTNQEVERKVLVTLFEVLVLMARGSVMTRRDNIVNTTEA